MLKEENYFNLLDLPVAFDVDLQLLTEHYRLLQKAVHPDKFANSSDQERLVAVQKASLVNEAYEVLKSPISRARYLLSLHGMVPNDNDTISDPSFLMQQMEIRESLEAASAQEDPLTATEDVMDDIENMFKGILDEIATLFRLNYPELEKISHLVLQLHFFGRLRNEAETQLAKLDR